MGPAKWVLVAWLVCGGHWVLFLVEQERLMSANLGGCSSARLGSQGAELAEVWPSLAQAKSY